LVFCCFPYSFVSFTGLGGVLSSCGHMLYVMEFVATLWIFYFFFYSCNKNMEKLMPSLKKIMAWIKT
jgi:hypothetical protein